MSSWWSPKPVHRNQDSSMSKGFSLVEEKEQEVVVKSLSALQKQRREDGTPMTVAPPTRLQPAEPSLVLRKGSLMEKKAAPMYDRKEEGPSPSEIVKAYLQYSKE